VKKRITSFLLAAVLLLGLAWTGSVNVHAASSMTTSDECIRVLKLYEGFGSKPYWDYSQYTVGYGTRCPDDMLEYYTQHGITHEEAEVLLRNYLSSVERDINSKIIDKYGITLTQPQFDALIMFSYNCGTAWVYETSGTFHNAIVNGATGNDLIRAFALWCNAGNQIQTHLLRRRLNEANMYINGVYPTTKNPPDNYCYVLYDANGGSVSPRSQGYDSALTAAPFPTPTMSGYTFQGWFTQKTGGTKVTVLDASTKNTLLYAQWADGEGNAPPSNDATPNNPVTVTVTGIDVNLREGPGTNYTSLGKVNKGQQLTITEIASGSGYTWGKSASGWVALMYTTYDTVINTPATPPVQTPEEKPEQKPEEKPEQKPEETPEQKPEEKPEQKPEEKPSETPTTPPVTTPTTWKGTVTADELLIRKGPGLENAVVGWLVEGTKVTITERKMGGSLEWGKIDRGWICLKYVRFDTTSSGSTSSGNTSSGSTSSGSTTTPTTPKPVTGTVKVNDYLRIRKDAGTNNAIVGYLKPNTKVTITEQKTVNGSKWGKIDKGWICMDYVVLNSQSSSGTTTQKIKGTVIADCLHIRKDAGTKNAIVGYLYYGTKVEILATKKAADGSTWGQVSNGWVHMGYIKK